MPKDPDIIVYGGSFDPPHRAHVQMLELVTEEFPQAKIIAIVSPNSAVAGGEAKDLQAGLAAREEMLKLALGRLSSRVELSDIEKKQPEGINYTYKTITQLENDFPGKTIAFLMGQDQFASFYKWKNPKDILRSSSLIAVRRNGAPRSLSEDLELQADQLDLSLGWIDARTASLGDQVIYLLNENLSEVSSTEVRRRLSADESMPSDWIASKVKDYIIQHHLYQQR